MVTPLRPCRIDCSPAIQVTRRFSIRFRMTLELPEEAYLEQAFDRCIDHTIATVRHFFAQGGAGGAERGHL